MNKDLDDDLEIRTAMDIIFQNGNDDMLIKIIAIKVKYNIGDISWYDDLQMLDYRKVENVVDGKIINATNISKSYKKGDFKILPLDIEISKGEIVGIVGENGNGKTTLLRMLGERVSLNSGNLSLNIKGDSYFERKSNTAFIPQRIPRWYGKLKDNLHFACSIKGIHGKKNDLYVEFILQRFNLKKYENLTWDQISSGYRTRLEVAKIIMQKPSLLILDEPLANLDINAQQTFLTDLKLISKSSPNGICILLSSHQLYEVEKIADKVIMIKDGSLAFASTEKKDDLFRIEFETIMTKVQIAELLEPNDKLIFNGSYYSIYSDKSADILLKFLLHKNVPITYYRDITNSAKSHFNIN